jgi:hypothetical protein
MIIGILGHSCSGKDTAADYLVRSFSFTKISLADPLKRICKEVYDFSDQQLWGPSECRNAPDKRYPLPNGKGYLTPRMALQTLGTEWGRSLYEHTWTDLAIQAAKEVYSGRYTYVQTRGLVEVQGLSMRQDMSVIPDCRFASEIERIKAAGGVILRLYRQGKCGNIDGGIPQHPSEEEQKEIPDDKVDYVLRVPEGIINFHHALDTAMDALFIKLA